MDETEENQDKPKQELEPADAKILQSVGIEVLNQGEATPETDDASGKKTPEMMGIFGLPSQTGGNFAQKNQAAPIKKNDIKPIRTYKTDAEEAVQNNKTSVIDMVVAENKKKESAPIVPKGESAPRGLLWFSIILILIALIVVAGTYYFLIIVPNNSPSAATGANIQTPYAPLIQVQATKTIAIDSKDPKDSFASAITALSSAPVGSTVNLVPLTSSGSEIATSTDFFPAIGVSLPTQISLSLDGFYTLGAIISSPNHPFLILGLSSFENAFAGMLGWEKAMHNDLAGLIQIEHPNEPAIAIAQSVFVDKTINNQDVRELLDASGSPILLYTFIGATRLVITTDTDAMSSVINALNTTNTTR